MNRKRFSIFNRMKGRSWYSIDNKADTAEVMIYDEIGIWGVDASSFVRDFNAIDAKTVNVRLNTPGGSVFDGIAIANAIKEHPATIDMNIDSLAASIGSIIALSGDSIKMAKNAYFMIHNPWGMAIGDAEEMRKTAGLLDKITETLSQTYVDRTGEDSKQVNTWMNDETWFTAQEALDAGFIDEITGDTDTKAAFDLSVYAKTPAQLKNQSDQTELPKTEREFEAFLRDAGFSRSQAKTLASNYKQDGLRDADLSEIGEIVNNSLNIWKG